LLGRVWWKNAPFHRIFPLLNFSTIWRAEEGNVHVFPRSKLEDPIMPYAIVNEAMLDRSESDPLNLAVMKRIMDRSEYNSRDKNSRLSFMMKDVSRKTRM
jgi:hypothetical protein